MGMGMGMGRGMGRGRTGMLPWSGPAGTRNHSVSTQAVGALPAVVVVARLLDGYKVGIGSRCYAWGERQPKTYCTL